MKNQLMRPWTLVFAAGTSLFLATSLQANSPEKVDPSKNVYIPHAEDRVATLRVGAVYNQQDIQIRYEFVTDNPSWYHQYWIYEGGEWVRYGSGSLGPDDHGLYEDRISMMLDDGSVDGFDRYGGYMTVHDGMRSLTSAASRDEVRGHAVLGREMGRSDIRKYLPSTRDAQEDELSWHKLKDSAELDAMRKRGEFLDLWQWRAHRSHPVGYADNNYVLHYRLNSEGRGAFTTNWDADNQQPAWMYNPEITGITHLERERLLAREYSQQDWYYLSEAIAKPFDPDREWQEGDVLPQRFLREPSGSRGAIRASGGYQEGAWRIQLTRSLDSPNVLDSKTLRHGESYNVAFAVHTNASGARWHLVSLPQTLGLGVEQAGIVAHKVDGDLNAAEVVWTELKVFYPGQTTWQWLHSDGHPGKTAVESGAIGVRHIHSADDVSNYSVEVEKQRVETSQ